MSEYTKLGKVKCIQSIRKHKYKRALIDRSQIWWLDDGDHGWVMVGQVVWQWLTIAAACPVLAFMGMGREFNNFCVEL